MWGMDKVDDSEPQKRVCSECCLNRYNPALNLDACLIQCCSCALLVRSPG